MYVSCQAVNRGARQISDLKTLNIALLEFMLVDQFARFAALAAGHSHCGC